MQSFSRLVLRWSGLVTLLGILSGALGLYYTIELYKNLRTDIEELLPTTARSVVDLNQVTQRLESIEHLAVFVFSEDTRASKRLILDLATRLDQLPRSTIAGTEYRIDRELEFFRDRQALYMEVSDLERIRDFIATRIEYERELHNPINIFGEREIPEPSLDFEAMRKKYVGKMSGYDRFPEGFYATPDAKVRILLANMPGKSSSIKKKEELKHAVEQTIAELKPETYAADIKIKYAGGVQETLEEHEALISDLGITSVLVFGAVGLAMLIFFRSFRGTFLLVYSVFIGCFWTFGLSYFVVGYLNANSAFLGSIIIGNGVNFGIIFLGRYFEERKRRVGHERATMISMVHTATATWTASLAAGLSYGSLILTDFRGFNQFGLIGLIGMIVCWLSAFTVLPAALTLLDRTFRIDYRVKKVPKPVITTALANFVSRFPGPIWVSAFIVSIISVATLFKFDASIMETNLGKLRNRESIERGAGYLTKYMDQIFQRYLSPIVILAHSEKDAKQIAGLLEKKKAQDGKSSMIAGVSTIHDFLPDQQSEKIRVLMDIRRLLPPRLFYRLSENDQRIVNSFLTPAVFTPITHQNLPPLVLAKFTERDGSVGKMVVVEPPHDTEDIWKGEKLTNFIRTVRETADSVSPGAPVAGSIAITSDLYQAISRDGPKATLFAFLAVVLLVIFLFRNWQTISLVLFALILGMLWMLGLIMGFWLKINFLNFIALPITFGIGVDYGVNIFQRYREEGGKNILKVLRETGGAVGLCSVTTIIGYSSLLLAGNQGFVSFGLLAVLGELTCVIAAMMALPAFLLLQARKRTDDPGTSPTPSRRGPA